MIEGGVALAILVGVLVVAHRHHDHPRDRVEPDGRGIRERLARMNFDQAARWRRKR